ncbi:hypothetical protein [Tenacibaculum sp. 190524A02b]|uniref:hypothetical protein n=1 Tax=Tenacibaculum vairaonense TaxID=3137860 RepID=UPI0031FB63D0
MKLIFKAILLSLCINSCKKVDVDDKRIIEIGKKLTQKEFNYQDIVIVGDRLKENIVTLHKNTTEFEFVVTENDLQKPFGNNKADCVLTVKSDYKNIRIRLKYDKELDKYHILGWTTLENDL